MSEQTAGEVIFTFLYLNIQTESDQSCNIYSQSIQKKIQRATSINIYNRRGDDHYCGSSL